MLTDLDRIGYGKVFWGEKSIFGIHFTKKADADFLFT